MKLSMLKIGERAIIKSLDLDDHMKNRLLDLGFVRDTVIEAVQSSPSGNPIAYRVRNTIFAIRTKEADGIEIEVIEND